MDIQGRAFCVLKQAEIGRNPRLISAFLFRLRRIKTQCPSYPRQTGCEALKMLENSAKKCNKLLDIKYLQ